MRQNLLVIHGGGPTVVLNSSLYGVIREAQKHLNIVEHIWGARNGVRGLLEDDFIELEMKSNHDIDALLTSPGTAIGSSRYPLDDEAYNQMVDHLIRNQIKYVLMSGGNGTMATCGELSKTCQRRGVDIRVVGIPKTMDNDISVIDHCPGYLSAAKYIIQTTREIVADVHSLPIHVCIIEAMGRNAGWISAASALAADGDGLKPDLIYLPERDFNEDEFLADVKRIYDEKGFAVVVASEGLHKENHEPIVPEIFSQGRAHYYGEVGNYLANLVVKRWGIKARNEKPGLAGRSSIYLQSSIDRDEAVAVGRRAVTEVLAGITSQMVGIFRSQEQDGTYAPRYQMVDIEKVMMTEKKLPESFINKRGNYVTKEFIDWLDPMLTRSDYFPIVNFN